MAAAGAERKIEVPAAEGQYLTDGKRLAQMVGLDDEGNFLLEDSAKPSDMPLVVTPPDLTEKWMTVEAFAKRRDEHGE